MERYSLSPGIMMVMMGIMIILTAQNRAKSIGDIFSEAALGMLAIIIGGFLTTVEIAAKFN